MNRPAVRIAKNAILLALFCLVGMFSIPLGENVKVSLQLLMVFLIGLIADSWIDALTVSVMYLLLGLFMPVYAGFAVGVSPTFGYVISFVPAAAIVYFMNKIPKIHPIPRMAIACLSAMPIVYGVGTLFMMVYLGRGIEATGTMLLVTVVPYLPFDAAKIVLAVGIASLLPYSINRNKKRLSPKEEGTEE